jgi:hypothetical protein
MWKSISIVMLSCALYGQSSPSPGKYADIIGVSGDPLQDANELQRVKFVMKGGAVIRNELGTK